MSIDPTRLAAINTAIVKVNSELETLSAGSPCDVAEAKEYEGEDPTTDEGDLCRLLARTTYLTKILKCEANPYNGCCGDAEQEYCEEFEACPA